MLKNKITLIFLTLLSLQTFGQDVVYNFNTTTEGFTSSSSVTLSSSNGAIVRDFGTYEAVLTPDLNLSEDDYKVIRIVVRNNSTFNNFKLFNLDNPGTNWSAATSVIVDIPQSTEFVTRDILIPKNSDNSGVIHQLALRALGNPDENIEIAQIVLIETGNWVTNNNFETSSNWTASGTDVTAGFTTTDPQEGTQSGTLTFTADQVGNKFLQSATTDFGETVSPTDINTTLWVKSSITGAIVSLVYSLKDATGAYLGQISTGNHTISSADTWELATFNKADLTNTFNRILIKIKVVGGLDGTVISFDDVQPSVILYSTDNSWTGAKDTEWTDIANWTNGVAPTATKDSNVQVSANNPVISGATEASVNNLDIDAGAALTIASGGSLIVSGTSSGNVTYNRNLATTDWYLVSSPVEGQDIDAFVLAEGLASGTGSNLGLGDYDNSTPDWTYYLDGASGTGNFTSGDGRAIKLVSTGDISFTGTINTSNVTLAMTSNSNGFNLVGNPYTSYVAGNENADGTNNILTINSANLTENTLWFWNQSTDSYNQINQASAAFQIAPAQGFFVSASGSVDLSITEAMQSHQGTDNFQRTTNRPEMNITMTNGTASRDTDIFYIDGTTTGFDNGYDSSIFGGATNEFAIYTHAVANGSGRNLGIQSLPPNNYENMIIPVGVNAISGTYITIDASINNFPSGINIYLEDKQDNSFTLLDADANFSTTLENSLSGIGRFYLHTTSTSLSVNDLTTSNNLSIYNTNRENLRIAGVQNGTATIQLYNILGKEVLRTSFEGKGVNDITLPNLVNGVYIIKLATENRITSKKIIIQ